MIDEPLTTRLPPLSPRLREALANLRPVRTRRPWASFVVVVGVSSGYAALVLASGSGLRDDLAQVPWLTFVAYGAACLTAFGVLLALAFVPARGQVLPSGSDTLKVTLPLLAALGAFHGWLALSWPAALPAADPAWSTFAAGAVACGGLALGVVATPVAVALWSLRRALPVDAWRILVAVGGAEGALGGLVLHLHCAQTDAVHVGLVHGAILFSPSLLLAAIAVLTRPREEGARFP